MTDYAVVVAENERLREEVRRLRHQMTEIRTMFQPLSQKMDTLAVSAQISSSEGFLGSMLGCGLGASNGVSTPQWIAPLDVVAMMDSGVSNGSSGPAAPPPPAARGGAASPASASDAPSSAPPKPAAPIVSTAPAVGQPPLVAVATPNDELFVAERREQWARREALVNYRVSDLKCLLRQAAGECVPLVAARVVHALAGRLYDGCLDLATLRWLTRDIVGVSLSDTETAEIFETFDGGNGIELAQ